MLNKKIILVGAAKPKICDSKVEFGGVLTLSSAIHDFSVNAGFNVEVIDTSVKRFTRRKLWKDFLSGSLRLIRLVNLLLSSQCKGVIIFTSAGLGFYEKILMSVICRLFKTDAILFIVDGWFFSIRKKSYVKRIFISLLLKLPAKLVSSGRGWYKLFTDLGVSSAKIVNIHYWLPESFLIRKINVKPPITGVVNFIFVGWMIREKGIYEILSALDYLLRSHELNFTFVGDGPELENVRSLIRRNSWESRVSALGKISTADKESLLDASHVFVLPSYAEGFPMSLIEAMTVGLPAICSDVGGVSDSLQHGVNGFLVKPRSSDELMFAMEYYIKNPSIISLHSSKSLEIVKKNHNPSSNCATLLSAFTHVDS